MANEVTVPMLPCRDIDEISDFYRMLGFERTYRQTSPNPYTVLKLEDIELHFFGMDDFDPAESYSSCLVFVPDTGSLFDSFAAGMRAEHGKLLLSGTPRMTRPRVRKNTGRRSGFAVIDPGGNWIRFFAQEEDAEDAAEAEGSGESGDVPASRVARTLEKAIVLGDSKGDAAQAGRILDATLTRHAASAAPVELVEALVYRAELAVRLDDGERADALLAQVDDIELNDAQRGRLADALENAAELRSVRRGG